MPHRLSALVASAAFVFSAGGTAATLPTGSLDPAFGTGGVATFSLSSGQSEIAFDVAFSGSRIVAAGVVTTDAIDTIGDFAVFQLRPDGSPDPLFGSGGGVQIPINLAGPASNDQAFSLAIQADGRIVVAGAAETSVNNFDFAAVRLLPDGQLDPGFGDNGIVTVAFDRLTGGDDVAWDLQLLNDGKILLIGQVTVPFLGGLSADAGFARLNPDGSLDETFGEGGLATAGFPGGGNQVDYAQAGRVAGDGRIIWSGPFQIAPGLVTAPLFSRLTADGRIDESFGFTGARVIDARFLEFAGHLGMVLLPNGTAVLAYGAQMPLDNPTGASVGLSAVDSTGTLLWTNTELNVQPGSFDIPGDLLRDREGNFLIVGFTGLSSLLTQAAARLGNGLALPTRKQGTSPTSAFVARYGPSGDLDFGFANAGRTQITFPQFRNTFAFGAALGQQLVLSGAVEFGADDADFAVIQLLTDPGLVFQNSFE